MVESIDIRTAGIDDLDEILNLQKLAYISEAEIYDDFSIPPLLQTPDDLAKEAANSLMLKAVHNGKIIGSVRAYEKDGTCYIGKLIVHPDFQNKGIGKKLLSAIEKRFDGARYELFTGHLSEKNLAIYEKMGYKRFKTVNSSDKLSLIYLEKHGE